jgi:hypothetical protein
METTDLTQRLRALATRLLDAYELIDLPTTFAEADRAGKALISIGKAIALTGDEPPASKPVVPAAQPRKVAEPDPYLEIERRAKALTKTDKALRGGELSDAEIDAQLVPPDDLP